MIYIKPQKPTLLEQLGLVVLETGNIFSWPNQPNIWALKHEITLELNHNGACLNCWISTAYKLLCRIGSLYSDLLWIFADFLDTINNCCWQISCLLLWLLSKSAVQSCRVPIIVWKHQHKIFIVSVNLNKCGCFINKHPEHGWRELNTRREDNKYECISLA